MTQEPTSRREFMKVVVGAACSSFTGLHSASADQPRSIPTSHRKLEQFDYSGVTLLAGRLKDQYEGARDFFFNIPNDNLLFGFRQRAGLEAPGKPLIGWYGGAPDGPGVSEIISPDKYNAFGQYISGMARMAKASNDSPMRDKMSTLIAEWAKTIEPDGYFFYSRRPWTPHYIYEKTVCGLVDAYAFGDDKEAVNHLDRITAWAEKNLDRSRKTPLLDGVTPSANGTEWYTLSENLYRAFQVTGDARYRMFGELWHYNNYWGMFNGSVKQNPYGRHAYSHVNTFSSAAMAYSVTGDPQYLATIVNAHDWLQRTQVYATGGFGPGERIMTPDGSLGKELDTNGNTFETVCGSWAIFKMSRYLMAFTGEAKYGDWIEKTIYNGIGSALPLQPDGSNFYYSDYRMGGGRKIYSQHGKWTCCSGTYPQSIADYHNLIYFHDHESLFVNLFVPSEVSWKGLTLRQETSFPEAETSALTVKVASPIRMPLRIRIPGWCVGAAISVNGTQQRISCAPGTWALVDRTWSAGDRLTIDLPMHMTYVSVDSQHPKRVAVVYGPIVMVRRQSPSLVNSIESISKDSDKTLSFHSANSGSGEFVPFYSVEHDQPYEMYFHLS